jgi:hypothetical protein
LFSRTAQIANLKNLENSKGVIQELKFTFLAAEKLLLIKLVAIFLLVKLG